MISVNTPDISERQNGIYNVLPDYIINNFSLVKAENSPRYGGRQFGYSGYPLHKAAALDTVVLRRERALRGEAFTEGDKTPYQMPEVFFRHNEITGGIALISERLPQAGADSSFTLESDSGAVSLTTQGSGQTGGEYPAAYSGTAAALSLREQQKPAQSSPTAARHVKPNAPTQEELVSRFGNLIEGADHRGVSMSVTAQGGDKAVAKSLRELSARLNKAESKMQSNAEQLKELEKKQSELENSSLKSRDIRHLSDDVINRLRKQLRLDRSRYTDI